MSMYSLPPHVDALKIAPPSGIMYSLASFHSVDENGSVGGMENVLEGPEKELEQQQLDLIRRLTEFNAALDAHLAKTSSSPATNDKKSKKDAKADKPEKKDAKPNSSKSVKENPARGKPDAVASRVWSLKEDKVPAELNDAITACSPPLFIGFPSQPLGNAKLHATSSDIPWITSLSKVAAKKGFSFTGSVVSGTEKKNGTIEVATADSLLLETKDGMLSGRSAIAEFVGACFGVFSFAPENAIQSCHDRRWISKLDNLLSAGLKPEDVDFMVREMNQWLSRFDSLSTQLAPSLADLLLRPFVVASNLPGNVEMWAKRIDNLVS